ncbi:transmembrane protease serine 4-like [Fopius arisanus]|uniref:Transmembrane protease serine 4-like n=1 Tax=Fopius arisanus TaxID=64838 RepID=A0A9R1T7X8_9HYME|nr:PREDICTED: transmembrane protease serine 4-like [Fopius arisanus]
MCSLKIVCLLGGIAFGIHLEDTVRPRIFNGSPIRIENRPFMVSLNHKRKGFVCGGSILNKYWVLTASHCLPEGENPCNYYIRGGSTYLNSGSIRFLQKAVYFYSTKMNAMGVPENDILLLRPKNAFRFSRLLQPIKLPREGEQPPSKLWVTGWGATYATVRLVLVYVNIIEKHKHQKRIASEKSA